jgi:Skp family chaperone for outer membrane proteins
LVENRPPVLEIRYVNQSSLPTRRFTSIAAVTAAVCAVALLAAPASAQQTQQQPAVPTFQTPAQGGADGIPVVIGILDTQAVLNTSAAGKSLNTQWTAALKALNDDMAKKEDGLRVQAQQLEAQRAGNPPMAPADYQKKRQSLETQDQQFQQAYGKNKQALDGRLDKAREAITNAARKAMQEVAKAHGLTLILDRSAVPYSPQPWNVTDEVLQRLNKALPNVKL